MIADVRAHLSRSAQPVVDAAQERADRALAQLTNRPGALRLFVPGRIEVLGKHTDYAGGRSLTCAAERGFAVAYLPREDTRLRVVDGGWAPRRVRDRPRAFARRLGTGPTTR